MTWKVISFTEVMVPVEPYKQVGIVVVVENENGEKRFARANSSYFGRIVIGTEGIIKEVETPFGKLSMFEPIAMQERRKVALITGGSRGIGRAIAKKFAEHGYRVIIADIVEDAVAKETIKELEMMGAEPLFIKMDVSKQKDVVEGAALVRREAGHIDVIVNNAGITKDRSVEKMTESDWDAVMNVNLKGAFLVSKEFSELMKQSGGGTIINISSIVGVEGNIGQANYAASKAGLIALGNTLAKELAPYNIRVVSIAPGFVNTGMVSAVPQNIIREYLKKLPTPRLIEPEEIASLVLEIAENRAINGGVYLIDLGESISFPRT